MSQKNHTIYLLRHGPVNGESALNGHTDASVDTATQQHIASCINDLQFETIVSSPLSRCAALAEIVGSNRQIKPIIDQRLMEMDFGDLDGLPYTRSDYPWERLELFAAAPSQNHLPNSETLAKFQLRVEVAWKALVEEIQQDTLVIVHGGVIRIILAFILDIDWRNPLWYSSLEVAYASLTPIEVMHIDKTFYKVKGIGHPLLEL